MLENWLSLDPESRSTDWSWTLGLDRYQIPQRSQRLSWHRAWGLRLHPDYRHSEILNTGVESNLRHLCAEVCVSVWMCVPVQVRGTVAVWKYERSITERDVHLYTVYMSHLEVIQNKTHTCRLQMSSDRCYCRKLLLNSECTGSSMLRVFGWCSPVLSRCQGSVPADIGGMVGGDDPQLDSTSLPW